MKTDAAGWQRLGDAVRRARKQRDIRTLADFAMQVNISSKTLGQLEAGRRVGDDTLDTVAGFLNWSPSDVESIVKGRPVGAGDDAAAYVSHSTGSGKTESAMTDEDILELVKTARRLADLVERKYRGDEGSEPMEGAGPTR